MTRASVKPELLQWARERSRVAQEALAKKFKKLPEWESGETQPTLKQVEAFAHAVHVPVGYLFLSEPPGGTPPHSRLPHLRRAGRGAPEPEPLGHDLYLSGATELVSGFRSGRPTAGAGFRRQRYGRNPA